MQEAWKPRDTSLPSVKTWSIKEIRAAWEKRTTWRIRRQWATWAVEDEVAQRSERSRKTSGRR